MCQKHQRKFILTWTCAVAIARHLYSCQEGSDLPPNGVFQNVRVLGLLSGFLNECQYKPYFLNGTTAAGRRSLKSSIDPWYQKCPTDLFWIGSRLSGHVQLPKEALYIYVFIHTCPIRSLCSYLYRTMSRICSSLSRI